MEHFTSNIKTYSFILAIVLLIALGLSIYIEYQEASTLKIGQLILNVLSVIGVYFTILGIAYTFKQVVSVSEEVNKKMTEVNQFLIYSDINSTAKLAGDCLNDFHQEHAELAIYRLGELKSHLVFIKNNRVINSEDFKARLSDLAVDLKIDLNNINNNRVDFYEKVKMRVVYEHLGEIRHILEEIASELKGEKM